MNGTADEVLPDKSVKAVHRRCIMLPHSDGARRSRHMAALGNSSASPTTTMTQAFLKCGRFRLPVQYGRRPLVMGILNVTPDSFPMVAAIIRWNWP
jgi:hypothetical protein